MSALYTCQPATEADKTKLLDLIFNFDGRQSCSVLPLPSSKETSTLTCVSGGTSARPPLSQVYGNCYMADNKGSRCFFGSTQEAALAMCQAELASHQSLPRS